VLRRRLRNAGLELVIWFENKDKLVFVIAINTFCVHKFVSRMMAIMDTIRQAFVLHGNRIYRIIAFRSMTRAPR
jgi:hypothetical protein